MKNYGYAYEAAETMLSRVGDVDLADIPQMEPVRLELLETAKLQFHKLLEQQSNDPEVLLLEGRTRARLGDVLEMMGQYAEAEQNYRDAIDSLQALERRLPGDDRPLRARARADHGLGVLLRKLNRFREAESWLREAVRLREQLAARSPDDRELAQALSDSRYHLGALLARLASPDAEDRQLYDQAIKDQEALLQPRPGRPGEPHQAGSLPEQPGDPRGPTRPGQGRARAAQGPGPPGRSGPRQSLLAGRAVASRPRLEQPGDAPGGQGAATRRPRRSSRRHATRLIGSPPSFPEFFSIGASWRRSSTIWAGVGRDTKQNELAAEAFRQAADLLKELAQRNPQVPDYQEDLDIALFQLGLLKAETDLAAGEGELAPLLADQEKLIAAYPAVPDYRNALGRNLLAYGRLLHGRDESARASPLVEKAVARFQEALKEDPGNRTYGQNLTEAVTLEIRIAAERSWRRSLMTPAWRR